MPITPVPIPSAPPAPSRNDPATFEDRNDAAVEYQFETLPAAINQQAEATYQNALEGAQAASEAGIARSAAEGFAQDAQTAAAAAAATVGAQEWQSGHAYAVGEAVWSPINMQTYRRSTAGTGSIDPSLDADNWALLGGASLATLHATALLF